MKIQRRIRSFVLRAGRVTVAQERAMQDLWPKFGLEVGTLLDLDAVYQRRATRCLEIGFGAGEVIGLLAHSHPEIDYLGIEVHRAGVGRLLLRIEQEKLTNLRVFCHDAVEVLRDTISDQSFDEVLIFFPDPWHKKRHHKRRLIEAPFIELIVQKLCVGGVFRLATDWQPYAEKMLEVCNANASFTTLSPDAGYVARAEFRPHTRFEKRGERLGHGVWDLAYVRTS